MRPSGIRASVEVAWFTMKQQGMLGVLVFALLPLVFAGMLHAERLAVGQVVASFVETRARIDVDDPALLERLRADRALLAQKVDTVQQLLVVQPTPDVDVPRADGTVRVHLPQDVLVDGRFTVEGDTVSTEAVRLAMAGWIAGRWSDARLGGPAPAVDVVWRDGEPPPDTSMDRTLNAFGTLALGTSLLFGLIAGTRAFEHLRNGPGRVLRLLMPYRAVAGGVVLASLMTDVGSKVVGWVAGTALLALWLGTGVSLDATTISSGVVLVVCGMLSTLTMMGVWMWAASLVDGVSHRLQSIVFGPMSALGLAMVVGLTFMLYRWGAVLGGLPGIGSLGVWSLYADGDLRWIPLLAVQFGWAGALLELGVRGARHPGSALIRALQRSGLQ